MAAAKDNAAYLVADSLAGEGSDHDLLGMCGPMRNGSICGCSPIFGAIHLTKRWRNSCV